ncbi:MAG: fused MFS/spermidine synthase [Sphingomonadaceae bacterium]|nr:fused MFS/spermidine synthase [Sphingomonadaceae bacterium]
MTRTTRTALFVVTILVGSFLLFLVQPLVARMALPLLGGAPNVWNSAMLVYQALLLGGYAYAHFLSRWPLKRQAMVHVILLVLAGLTLPIALADLSPPQPGWEALWVPALLALTIGPVFFLVSAQAPLMQRWFAADASAGDPYWLYAASNIGSFAGLLSYPLLFEPGLSLRSQSLVWTALYAGLVLLVAAVAAARWRAAPSAGTEADAATTPKEPLGTKRILLWLALAAVPSGLMLSTTTHLTTDIVAMPLLWVIPLGLYLLSYVPAFAANRTVTRAISYVAPPVVVLAGSLAMVSQGSADMMGALAAIVMLFVVAVALHGRLYDTRPDASQLTAFYLIMSAGGALGGLFTALLAPLVFDWVWEHALLVLAAAILLPGMKWYDWMERLGWRKVMRIAVILACLIIALQLGAKIYDEIYVGDQNIVWALTGVIAVAALLVFTQRWAFVAILGVLMLSHGGIDTLQTSYNGLRSRSYFGIYTIREFADTQVRTLAHGTTMHGKQHVEPERALEPTSYYTATSGVGLTLANAGKIYGKGARVGVVGLGAGTLACYREPDQTYDFFEIDPAILAYSQSGTFTFMKACAPDAVTHIGDARLKLDEMPAGTFDVLVIDAFSSDAIPLHLITQEAIDTYQKALKPDGLLLFHISNRYIDLNPVLSAAAQERGWEMRIRDDPQEEGDDAAKAPSDWVVTSPDEKRVKQLMELSKDRVWVRLAVTEDPAWTDDYASILPFIRWENMLSKH